MELVVIYHFEGVGFIVELVVSNMPLKEVEFKAIMDLTEICCF